MVKKGDVIIEVSGDQLANIFTSQTFFRYLDKAYETGGDGYESSFHVLSGPHDTYAFGDLKKGGLDSGTGGEVLMKGKDLPGPAYISVLYHTHPDEDSIPSENDLGLGCGREIVDGTIKMVGKKISILHPVGSRHGVYPLLVFQWLGGDLDQSYLEDFYDQVYDSARDIDAVSQRLAETGLFRTDVLTARSGKFSKKDLEKIRALAFKVRVEGFLRLP